MDAVCLWTDAGHRTDLEKDKKLWKSIDAYNTGSISWHLCLCISDACNCLCMYWHTIVSCCGIGTIAAAAVINEIIAVIAAKKGFELAGEIHAGNPTDRLNLVRNCKLFFL